MCLCIWKPELNLKYCSSGATCLGFFSGRVCHWTWSLPIRLDWLASKFQGSSCLFLLRLGSQLSTAHNWLFLRIQVLMSFCDKHAPDGAISAANHPLFKLWVFQSFPWSSLWSTKWRTMFWDLYLSVPSIVWSNRFPYNILCYVLWSCSLHTPSTVISHVCLPPPSPFLFPFSFSGLHFC